MSAHFASMLRAHCLTRFLVSSLVLASTATAQSDAGTFFLPEEHWSVDAVRRLSRLDMAPRRFGWGDASLTALEVGRVLRYAEAARAPDDPLAALARGYWERFAEEFPATVSALSGDSRLRYLDGALAAGYENRDGVMMPGRAFGTGHEDVGDPEPIPDLSEPSAHARVNVAMPALVGGTATIQQLGNSSTLLEGHALLAWRGFGVWAGRRAPRYGPAAGGGLLFNGTAPFDAVGVSLTEPLLLPWILRLLGPIRFESFISRLDSNATITHPWVLGSRVSISPHPRVLIGGTMGAMFGGDEVAPVTLRTIWKMFTAHGLADAGTEFENGMASFDIRFRPPVGSLPLVLYLEWAADDNHAAWTRFPARAIGAEVTALPGLPSLSVGLERTTFAPPCPGQCEYYAMWYRHYLFLDGWTLDRRPIGHPLGGEGEEWLAYTAWEAPQRGVRVSSSVFLRDRGTHNLFSQTRNGRSAGTAITLQLRAAEQIDLFVRGSVESGTNDWQESGITARIRWLF